MVPTLMKWEKPMLFWVAHPRMALPMEPLWEMKAMLPGLAEKAARLALRWLPGHNSPMQSGPKIAHPGAVWASSWMAWRMAAPSSPGLLSPRGDDNRRPGADSPHSLMTAGAVSTGMQITARSTGLPTAAEAGIGRQAQDLGGLRG